MTKIHVLLCTALVACLAACDAGMGATTESAPAASPAGATLQDGGSPDCCPMEAAKKAACVEKMAQCEKASKCEMAEMCEQNPQDCPKCAAGACDEQCEKPAIDE